MWAVLDSCGWGPVEAIDSKYRGQEKYICPNSTRFLVLDEIGMCNPRIIDEMVYMLGNGTEGSCQ